MIRTARAALSLLPLALVALVASILNPSWRSVIVAVSVMAGFVALAARTTGTLAAFAPHRPGPFDRALESPRGRPGRPSDLEAIERAVGWRKYSRRDFELRVRPLLRRLIAYKLSATRRIDVGREPEAARRALPADLHWVMDDNWTPRDPELAVDTSDIADVVDAIDAL